jgi:hypothetical protein
VHRDRNRRFQSITNNFRDRLVTFLGQGDKGGRERRAENGSTDNGNGSRRPNYRRSDRGRRSEHVQEEQKLAFGEQLHTQASTSSFDDQKFLANDIPAIDCDEKAAASGKLIN